MALQLGLTTRNAMLDAIEADLLVGGTAPIMRIRVGAPPASCADADGAGTLLSTITLPADPFQNASAGSKAKSVAQWQDVADGAGLAGHFRIYRTDTTTCIAQGTITATGGGGDMTVDNPNFVASQTFTVTAFTINAANG